MPSPEPWLRGPLPGIHPVIAHVFYTFQQCREELDHWTQGLADEAVWRPPAGGLAPLGFHLRHLAGSADRLFSYLEQRPLSAEQLAFLKRESEPGASLADLRAELEVVFSRIEAALRDFYPAHLLDERSVGRQALPTTAGGLIVHLAEHTQRHLGQAVLTSKLLRESR